MLLVHSKIHSAEIRHQPDNPDKKTVLMKFLFRFFASFIDYPGSPDSVNQHQPKSNLPRESMRFEDIKRAGSETMHKPSTVNIKKKANPETHNVPFFKVMRIPFRPDTKRVKDQSQCN